ncbi:MAG: pyruvate kinase [Flavobacteriaceae bacterium]
MSKKTKIVATLGPATNTKEILRELIVAGVNVFRINFSHADYTEVSRRIKLIRELNEELGFNVAILADLQGPKLRVGVMDEGVVMEEGQTFTFTTQEGPGTNQKAFMTYQRFPKDVKAGEFILVDDGKLKFEVISTDGKENVVTKVLRGGPLKSKKGVNLPNTAISLPALTEKDVDDAKFAIGEKVDWIALSFVRNPEDLDRIHKLIAEESPEFRIPVISKIEKPEAIENIDAIMAKTDGIMVARGDLGVEIPAHEVPLIQKELVRKAKIARKPVIIATQMMETMIDNEVPTRAEVNDVANSIMDGADAVMLSGETSVGKYPVTVIQSMRNIIESVETSELISVPRKEPKTKDGRFITKSICQGAAVMADNIDAEAIMTITNTGYTAFHISSWRPNSNILAYADNPRVCTMLNLLWGVKAFYYDAGDKGTNQSVVDVNNMAISEGYVKPGDLVINLASMPAEDKGMTNTLRITEI